jgi:SsrA-binding protein
VSDKNTRPPSKANRTAIKLIAENKKARFDYVIEDVFEAGIELVGSEVKSLRAGDVNLKDSYVSFKKGEAYLQNAHISFYRASSYNNHEPERLRKLLLKASELVKIDEAVHQGGKTCVPLKIYFKGGWAKLEIALARGKNLSDKRQSSKARDADREVASAKRKNR